jgi:hypothetical protein
MSEAVTKAAETALTPAAPAKASWVQQFVARAHSEVTKAPPASPVSYVRETGSAVAEFTAGGITGSLLGATHAKWGLDTKKGPVDGWVAGLGAIASVALSGHMPDLSMYIRRVAAQAFTVLSFRKGYEVVKNEPLPGGTGGGVHRMAIPGRGPGVTKVDPIEAASEGLGL